MILTSVLLRKLDTKRLPIGIAYSCLIDYREKRFILSVQHAVKSTSQDWAIELKHDEEKGTEVYQPNYFNYAAEISKDLIAYF